MSLSEQQIKRIWCECKSIDNHAFAIEFARAIERAATIAAMRRCAEICERAARQDRISNESLGWSASVTPPESIAEAIRAEITKLEAEK